MTQETENQNTQDPAAPAPAPEPKKGKPVEITPEMRLDMLKHKADVLGIGYASNVSEKDLLEKIKRVQAINEKVEAGEEIEGETDHEFRERMYRDCMWMVRCRITNMNPAKADLQGEILTVANKYVGTVRKFIPFGEATEKGWHVPKILFDMLKEREFLQVRTVKKGVNAVDVPETRYVKEFALEILPQLTEEELRLLAIKQAAERGQLTN